MEEQMIEIPSAPVTEAKSKKFSALLKNAFSEKNLKKTVSVLVVVAVLIVAAFAAAKYLSPEAVAMRYAKAAILSDIAAQEKVSAYSIHDLRISEYKDEEDFLSHMPKLLDEDLASWKEYVSYVKNQQRDWLEDHYSTYKIEISTVKTRNQSVRKLTSNNSDLIKKLEEKKLFDSDKITDAKYVQLKAKIIGEDTIEREYINVYLCKVGGLWKVLTTN